MKKTGRDNKIAVIVGSITNDVRIHDLPSLKVWTIKIIKIFLMKNFYLRIWTWFKWNEKKYFEEIKPFFFRQKYK
jgi:hypothetical protein